jgi:carboxyl-terminal processing protease
VIRQTVASVPFAALLVFLQLTTTTPIPASASENPARSPQEISTTLPSAERRTALAETTLLTALQQDSTTALDEAWTLIDKYYIDRSFGGQDWKAVKEKYTRLAAGVKGDAALLKLTTEMVNTLGDKYSRILDPKQYAAIQKYDLIGVGVTLMPDQNKHIVVGAPPIAGSAADRAGLRQGDFVTAINGISTAGRTAFDIIDQISEHPNAPTVAMTVRPVDGAEAATEIVMERTFEEVKDPVRYRISETRPDGTKVGLIKITEFNSLVKGSLEKALSELRDAGANAYVLDIRQNTGGAFQSAVEISGLFVEDRVATYVVDNTDVKLPFRTPKGRLLVDPSSPLVIWMDGRSASASEVLAGSLHDNCRAVLMGEKTFGKGLIQAVYGLKNGAGLVLTVARYVTPSGSDIQGVGIAPDVSGNIGPFGLGTDTSKIDFGDVSRRLSVTTCKVPEAVGS